MGKTEGDYVLARTLGAVGKERKERAVVADIRDQDGHGGKNEGRRFRPVSLVRRRLWPSSLVPIRVFAWKRLKME